MADKFPAPAGGGLSRIVENLKAKATLTSSDPFQLGCEAYRAGVGPDEGNPFDAGEQASDWDDWEDGWATARLEAFDPWFERACIGLGYMPSSDDFDGHFDNGLSADEAIAEYRIELAQQEALDSIDPKE